MIEDKPVGYDARRAADLGTYAPADFNDASTDQPPNPQTNRATAVLAASRLLKPLDLNGAGYGAVDRQARCALDIAVALERYITTGEYDS